MLASISLALAASASLLLNEVSAFALIPSPSTTTRAASTALTMVSGSPFISRERESRTAEGPREVELSEILGIFPSIAQHSIFASDDRPVLLWDGTCGFCDAGVWTFIDQEAGPEGGRGGVRFATQESELGLELLSLIGESPQSLNSVALYDSKGRVFTHSAACLYLSRLLKAPLRQVGEVGSLLPKFLRDAAYNWVADHRHQLLGTKDSCRLPTEEQLSRFITDL